MILKSFSTPFLLFTITCLILCAIFAYVSIISCIEKEYRAARVSLLLFLLTGILFLLLNLIDFPVKETIIVALLVVIWFSVIILLVPFNPKVHGEFQIPTKKHDERNVMFSRNELQPGTEKFDSYYSKYPHQKEFDDKFREKPGLLSPEAKLYHLYSFTSANANLEVIEILKSAVNGDISTDKKEVVAGNVTRYIKSWCKQLGVHTVGVTELKDYHVYSHKGRGDLYGKEIRNNHTYAIAITVEMEHDMIQTAPHGPVVMESTQQYLNAGTVALQIAHFIRNLGYSARAHIDGNYEVICPLVARDAGLGEIGRMGLLMTPKLGPRVRIAVVTTDIPLAIDKKNDLSSVVDFCEICKKCADICPSRSIPTSSREKIDGVLRWKINSESCFTYWCTTGTDCGRCMAVCPYSHPNNFMHTFIRWGIKNSYIFRRFALYMDDLFYGRKPKSRKLPRWIDI